jgi:predicted HicB family RNase H-like nuclease
MNKKLMNYKGYHGKIEYDDDDQVFHGIVIDINDVVTFEGESVAELYTAFQDSIENYLEYCSKTGRKPEKPHSGKIPLRISPELHQRLDIAAHQKGKSINKFVEEILEKEI